MGSNLLVRFVGASLFVTALSSSSGCSGCGGGGASGNSDFVDASAQLGNDGGGGSHVRNTNDKDREGGTGFKPKDAGNDPDLDAGTDAGPADAGWNDGASPELDAGTDAGIDAGYFDYDAATPGPGCVDDLTLSDGGVLDDVGVVINEVAAYPLQDWSHSDTKTDKFTATPGAGTVDSSDQFIELYNGGALTLDMRGWVLEFKDLSPSRTKIGTGQSAGTVYSFSAGSSLSSFKPGAYMVVGNPSGFLSTDVYVTLRAPCGALVDDVEVGGNVEGRDPEGDGLFDGAPSERANGRGHGAFDEVIARFPNASDTDTDDVDFRALYATPLGANVYPAINANDHTAPSYLSGPSGQRFAVSAPIRVKFNERLDGFSAIAMSDQDVPKAMRITVDGKALALGEPDLEDGDTTLVVNPIGVLPFDKDIVLTVSPPDGALTDRAGNAVPQTSFSFKTEAHDPANGDVLINEVVCSPTADYNHDGEETGFNGTIGLGGATSDDEFIELYNLRSGTTNFGNYKVTVYNGPNTLSSTRITFKLATAAGVAGTVVKVFGQSADVSAVKQGDYVVIGNPPTTLRSDIYIDIRDSLGTLIDWVEIGGNTSSNDRAGNGKDNGAPAAGDDGRSAETGEDAIARSPNGVDTGDSINDFCRMFSTLGAANTNACTTGSGPVDPEDIEDP